MADTGFAFNWDSTVANDSQFVTLDEGDYLFTVKDFQRGNYNGSDKLPACPQAEITIEVKGDQGSTTIQERFPMCSKMEWKISSFFRAIGMKSKGQQMDIPLGKAFQQSIGKVGKCHVTCDEGKNAGTYFNHVQSYFDYDPADHPQDAGQQQSFNFGGNGTGFNFGGR